MVSTVATTITVASGTTYGTDLGDFPTTAEFRVRVDDEIMLVTGLAHPVWTVTRGVGSTAATHDMATAVVTQVLTTDSIRVIPDYAQDPHGAAAHTGSVFPTGDQSITGNLNPDAADSRSVGNTNRMNLVSARTLRTEDVLGATPTGGADGDLKAGASFWWKSNGAWHSSASGGGGGTAVLFGDYYLTWDGTTANAVNGRNGNTDYTSPDGSGTGFHTVWNQAVNDLAGRANGAGGLMVLVNLQSTNAEVPVYGTLETCHGLTLVGTGYGKRDQTGLANTGSVVLAGHSGFVTNPDLPPIDGRVLLNCSHVIPRTSVSTASWSGGTITVTTSTPHGLVTNDLVYITGASPSGYNMVGDNSSLQIVVTSPTTFTYSKADPGAYVSGGTVYLVGTRENVTIDRIALDGNNAVDVTLLVTGTGTGNAVRVSGCQLRGGLVNTVQMGSRATSGGSGDVYMTWCQVSHNNTSAGTELALVACYAGDGILLYNNFAVPQGNAMGLLVQSSGTPVFIGWNHIGGGGSSKARVKIVSGQNVRIESNYIDNCKDTVNGAVWVRPTGGAVIQLMVRNNYFNMNGAVPWVVFDGTTSTNAARSVVQGNQTNGNNSAHCPAIVKFISWAANKPVDILYNVGQATDAVSTGDPANMQGTRWGNMIGGLGVNGDAGQEWISYTGVGSTTSWDVTHHLFAVPTHVQLTPTNAAAAASSAYVSAAGKAGSGKITITTTLVSAPSWDIFVKV